MKRLSGWDATFLYSETPNVHMHTLKIGVLELGEARQDFTMEAFRAFIGNRLYKTEPLGYQLVEVPLKFHHPMWRENCEIDLDYHIRPWPVSAPGGRRQFDEVIGEIASTPLDRRRPLWEIYVVEGLAHNRIGVIGKIHHALADGVASANLLARGMDLQPTPERRQYLPDPAPGKLELMGSAFVDHLRQIGRIPRTVRYTAQGFARVRRSSLKFSSDLARPFAPPRTFMNHVLAPERKFATATLALADVKQAAKRLEGTINDMVLAMSTGALRTLSLRYDGKAEPLIASVPVSYDPSPERISGNSFSGMLVALPVDCADPLEWVRRCHANAISAKGIFQLVGPELLPRWTAYAPPVVSEGLFRRSAIREGQSKMFNVNISNVAGPRQRGRVDGTLVTEIYSVGPLMAGIAVNITVWSYADQLNISVLTDDVAVQDPHEVTDAMIAAFIHIRRAAGISAELATVETAMAPA
ncbi:MAG: wax ester/triacylglycerol synthase family O-acyltransferase [Mycobacteriaceae bacterium]|nr:wax ester/triacylglycerol synthase family O-acyltransferase [Mycobacteriaceae bacterium]